MNVDVFVLADTRDEALERAVANAQAAGFAVVDHRTYAYADGYDVEALADGWLAANPMRLVAYLEEHGGDHAYRVRLYVH